MVTRLTYRTVHACMSFGTNSKDECILGAWTSIHAYCKRQGREINRRALSILWAYVHARTTFGFTSRQPAGLVCGRRELPHTILLPILK